MPYFRNLGAFIRSKVSDVDEFAKATGYSLKDIGRIFDGRLLLSPTQMKNIANVIGCTLDDMIYNEYSAEVEYVGKFSDKRNEEMLHDYIDRYVDLKEAVNSF